MKNFICIFGAITFVMMDLGLLFKIMHWPGGAVLLLLTMGLLLPAFIICTAVYVAKQK
ncbi:MAG: hypothetical protein MJZ49_06020 [Bacteroidales bacterium]|nr:hypothetical protein [Bacteroidales bacterium]